MATLTEIIDVFLVVEVGSLDKKTVNWYRARLRPFAEHCNGKPLTELTVTDIEAYRGQERRGGASWSTRNGTYTALKRLFHWAADTGHISCDVFASAHLRRPRKPKSVHRTIPLRYVEMMLRAAEAEDSLRAIRDLAVMRVLISTGIRRLELVGLRFGDVDMETGEVLVLGKYDNERVVFLDDDALAALRAWLAARPDTRAAALFISLPKRQAVRPDAINDWLIYWKGVAKIPSHVQVSPHCWRHTYATEYIAAGGDALTLKELMGHSDLSTTEIYVKLSRKLLGERARKFAPKVSSRHDQ